jgi:plasmid maintenance system killer protein
MEVEYEDPRFETFLGDERALRKAHGAGVVKKLAVRLTAIHYAAHLAELHRLPGRTHPK